MWTAGDGVIRPCPRFDLVDTVSHRRSSLVSPNHQIPVRGADVCSLSGRQSKLSLSSHLIIKYQSGVVTFAHYQVDSQSSLFSPNHQIPVRGGDVCSLSGRQSKLSLSSHLIIKYQSGVLTFAHYQVDSRSSLSSHLIIKYQSGVLTFAHYQVYSRSSLSSHLIIKYQSGVVTFAHYQVDSRISLSLLT